MNYLGLFYFLFVMSVSPFASNPLLSSPRANVRTTASGVVRVYICVDLCVRVYAFLRDTHMVFP